MVRLAMGERGNHVISALDRWPFLSLDFCTSNRKGQFLRQVAAGNRHEDFLRILALCWHMSQLLTGLDRCSKDWQTHEGRKGTQLALLFMHLPPFQPDRQALKKSVHQERSD